MKHLGSAVLMTIGLLAFGATTASAGIVCNGAGDCWRTKERYAYPPNAGVQIYADDWKVLGKYRWREHEGRGYWVRKASGSSFKGLPAILPKKKPSCVRSRVFFLLWLSLID